MPDQINTKDASQDQQIVLLEHKIEDIGELSKELRERVRKLERWVWGAAAVISASLVLVGLISAVESKQFDEEETIGILTEKIKQWEIDQNITQPSDAIDKALMEWNQWEQ
jgi:hypothetical protein